MPMEQNLIREEISIRKMQSVSVPANYHEIGGNLF